MDTPNNGSIDGSTDLTQNLFSFNCHQVDGNARLSTFHTPHGPIEMPAFAPVGTLANVKTLEPRDLHELDCHLILSNTYHLYLRPGHQLVQRFGGLHKFMGWDGPMLTDSGGYQVFSLADQRKIDDEGVTFRSHIDGSSHRFTPESVIEIEEALGADIIMVLDECAEPLDRDYMVASLKRTHRWAEQCKAAQTRQDQALFGIVQGGIFEDLRQQSAAFLTQLNFPGYAVGGLAVGETKPQMYDTLDFTCPVLPEDKPRYLMGVGAPEDIVEAVYRGIDMFDCVLPTRIARNGSLLTLDGRINLRNARFAEDPKANEVTALRLGTIHNIHFMMSLMTDIRQAIAESRFDDFRQTFLERYQISNQKVRHEQRAKRLVARRSN